MSRPFETLEPGLVLGAYAVGVFPMADARDAPTVYWVEPRRRAIMPLDAFHLSRSLRRTLLRGRFTVTADQAFGAVLALCAEAADDRPDTWINPSIEQVFRRLHALGFAHSIEVWDGETLVGGLYGLALGRAFFGESMVSRAADASKVALAALVARLRAGGYTLLDCQFMTTHLASLGAIEVARDDYVSSLSAALGDAVAAGAASGAFSPEAGADFFALERVAAGADSVTVSGPLAGNDIVQLLAHTS